MPKIVDNSLTSPRSRHNLSENWTGSAEFGRLVPFHLVEMSPTEKVITCKPRIEMQMLPLVSPTFGKMDLYVHYFFVPHRLIWKDANQYLSKRGEGKDSIPPYFTPKQLRDYFKGVLNNRHLFKHWTSLGLPPFFTLSAYGDASNPSALERKTLLPFRAYQRIWWDFYRDPEVLRDESIGQYLNDGDGELDLSILADLRVLDPRHRTIKDNWISNLFSESGLGELAGIDLASTDINPGLVQSSNVESLHLRASGNPRTVYTGSTVASVSNSKIGEIDSVTIRKLEALTRLAERMSLSGKREIESLFALYGVKPTFEKLSLAQYVGGAKSTVLVSDITSSADTADPADSLKGRPLGSKAGAGYCAFNNLNIEYTAQEHGYLMGIFSVMPHVHYVQGFNRLWTRNKWEDFFQKSFERTGQVAVRKDEIRAKLEADDNVDMSKDAQTFAFTQPYYERKQGHDVLAGDFMYYHHDYGETEYGDVAPDLAYMHSMEMYVDYPSDRLFNHQNLQIKAEDFNKVFFYQGGSFYSDTDDHFHLCIDKSVVLESNMDGYAVPTIETTEEPHASKTALSRDTVL